MYDINFFIYLLKILYFRLYKYLIIKNRILDVLLDITTRTDYSIIICRFKYEKYFSKGRN